MASALNVSREQLHNKNHAFLNGLAAFPQAGTLLYTGPKIGPNPLSY
jgi:hypothetical protein